MAIFIADGGKDPVFNETAEFEIKEGPYSLLVEVWDKDHIGKDDFLGKAL